MSAAPPISEERSRRAASTKACPACDEAERKVKRVTLEHLLLPERRGDIEEQPETGGTAGRVLGPTRPAGYTAMPTAQAFAPASAGQKTVNVRRQDE